ncbi:hypothetical protein [Clavibacter michiganensis]|uniref:hypothetical protein n=1 Tax=Clavibacter michiganensis TaxID=28447 RepID=UPI001865F16A|nr:hypothetical protein [Clavibacter michiganensis]MBE3079419.1 hypothetical protein [Clavibacter michiganensis subsp. michiganensis]MDO4027604.1 hypothetical protein [Clavibacter michiganensis]
MLAPIVEQSDSTLIEARKGRKPLALYLASESSEYAHVADLERAFTLVKSDVVGGVLVAQHAGDPSGPDATRIAARIARAFARFAFPDEVYPFFKELRSKLQSKAGTQGPLGQVLDYVTDIRVRADQWQFPQRHLLIYLVIDKALFIAQDDYDPNWLWTEDWVTGVAKNETIEKLSMNRTCELILANLHGDRTTVAHLWLHLAETIQADLLVPFLGNEVTDCEVEAVSDIEFTYRDYRLTESLDLEVLSEPR